MAVRLVYGAQMESNYLAAGDAMAQSVQNGRFWEVSKQINRSFFGGSALSFKRFSHLATIHKPSQPSGSFQSESGAVLVRIDRKTSFSAVAGYLECIPTIGPMFAIVNAMYHTAGMFYSYSKLKNAVQVLNNVERTEHNIRRGEVLDKTNAVFTAALNFTMHQNHMVGSLLALVPLLKPITRLGQGAIFHIKEEVKARAERRTQIAPASETASSSEEV